MAGVQVSLWQNPQRSIIAPAKDWLLMQNRGFDFTVQLSHGSREAERRQLCAQL
jgi:hypothetical protein